MFPGLNTITSSRPDAPPRLFGASHSVIGGPPETAIFLSLPAAKNPMNRLSGDQNGDEAASVPANASAVSASSERTQSTYLPSTFLATKASLCPSGETASGAVVPEVVVPNPAKLPGGETKKRMERAPGCAGASFRLHTARPTTMHAANAAATHSAFLSRFLPTGAAVAPAPP